MGDAAAREAPCIDGRPMRVDGVPMARSALTPAAVPSPRSSRSPERRTRTGSARGRRRIGDNANRRTSMTFPSDTAENTTFTYDQTSGDNYGDYSGDYSDMITFPL